MSCERENNTILFSNLNHPKVVSNFLIELQSGINAGYEVFYLNFTKVQFIFPNSAVPIAGIIDYYENHKGIAFELDEDNNDIERSRILNPLIVEEKYEEFYRDPLNKVWLFNNYNDVFKLVSLYREELSRMDVFKEGVLNGVEWSLNEVMDNVIQHSNTANGFIMGQIHKNSKHVAFCIFDTGQGIYNSLKKTSFRPKHPIDALTLCIKEGVTRDKSIGQGNGMYGLSEIVKNNMGILNINIRTFKNLPSISFNVGCTSVDFQLDYDKNISIEQALRIGGKQSNFVNFNLENLENSQGEIEYIIKEKAQGYGTRKSGLKARNEIINIYKELNQTIILDFRGVNLISSSFADELIGKLVLEYGFFGFNNVIRLKNMNSLVQTIVQRSVSQRMAESLKEK